MKNLHLNYKLCYLISLLLLCVLTPLVAQKKTMAISQELKANSEMFRAKRTSLMSLGMYKFGPYETIEGKSGWGTTNSTYNGFSGEYQSTSERKKSFIMTANKVDTVYAKILHTQNISTLERNDYFLGIAIETDNDQVLEAASAYAVTFTTTIDTAKWHLIIIEPARPDSPTRFSAVLTDGARKIVLKEVVQWEDGTSGMFPFKGYELFMDGRSVAAVQMPKGTNWAVWLHNELDEELRVILAAGALALMTQYY